MKRIRLILPAVGLATGMLANAGIPDSAQPMSDVDNLPVLPVTYKIDSSIPTFSDMTGYGYDFGTGSGKVSLSVRYYRLILYYKSIISI